MRWFALAKREESAMKGRDGKRMRELLGTSLLFFVEEAYGRKRSHCSVQAAVYLLVLVTMSSRLVAMLVEMLLAATR